MYVWSVAFAFFPLFAGKKVRSEVKADVFKKPDLQMCFKCNKCFLNRHKEYHVPLKGLESDCVKIARFEALEDDELNTFYFDTYEKSVTYTFTLRGLKILIFDPSNNSKVRILIRGKLIPSF